VRVETDTASQPKDGYRNEAEVWIYQALHQDQWFRVRCSTKTKAVWVSKAGIPKPNSNTAPRHIAVFRRIRVQFGHIQANNEQS